MEDAVSVAVYHVTLTNGQVYGVAAAGKRDAMFMAQERARSDGLDASPMSAVSVGRGAWEYGTVLAY